MIAAALWRLARTACPGGYAAMRRVALTAAALTTIAAPASAQTDLGKNWRSGLYWSVAAPRGASWAMDCRFRPVTYEANRYDLRHWGNRFRTTGTGAARGRLPDQNGRCTLTKTGGSGPVGIALSNGRHIERDGTNDPARPAHVGIL